MKAISVVRNILHSNLYGVLLINIRRIFKQKLSMTRYDDEVAIRRIYEKVLRRELNLDNPQRFTEKLQWYKLNYRNPLMTICVDKIRIREYLESKGYGELLMPLVGTYRHVNEINTDSLPDNCIFKASHGSSMHIVKKKYMNKLPLSWKLVMYSWLKMNIYAEGREWPYKDVEPGIICEELVQAKTVNTLKDYKFFCFSGKPAYVQVDTDLLSNHHIDFYDIEWNLLPLKCQYPNSEQIVLKPYNYERMKEIAADLSKPFPHVRVDFYEYDDQLKIGELTFFDGSGFYSFHPDEYDYIFGQKFPLIKYKG